MNTRSLAFLSFAFLYAGLLARGQGNFQNLDFEQATIAPTPVNGLGGSVGPADAFPGWTVGGRETYVLYNNITLGSPAVCLMGPDFPNGVGFTPLQGSYSTWLYYYNLSPTEVPTLSQTGLVPANAQSINFLIDTYRGDPAVRLNGVNIPLVPVGGGRLAGNISAFAGSIAQLTFSTSSDAVGDNFLYFDDIQFSAQAAPEPSVFCLTATGALLLGWSGLRRRC
jgi:hypothetical protein